MSILSKIPKAPYNCYEIAHPTIDSCAEFSTSTFFSSLRYCIVLYGGLNVFHKLTTGKFTLQDMFRAIPRTLQSSIFLSFNALFFTLLICGESRLFKRVSLLTPSVAGIISSLLTIHLETPARRRLLAVYMLNITTETAYEFLCLHSNFKPIPYFVVFLYAVSVTAYIHRATSARDLLVKTLIFLTGQRAKLFDDEATAKSSGTSSKSSSRPRRGMWASLKAYFSSSFHDCGNGNCLSHTAHSGLKAFTIGHAINLALSLPSFFRGSPSINTERGMRLGAFLAATAAGTSGIQCLLQNTSVSEYLSAKTRLTIAVFLSSFSVAIYPSRRVVLHLFWRTLASYSRFDVSPHPLPELTYAICCAILAFFVVFEPQTLRRGYMKFLDQLSGDKLKGINRHPLEIYSGCYSSKLYPDYFPLEQLNFDRVSTRFLEQVLVWSF